MGKFQKFTKELLEIGVNNTHYTIIKDNKRSSELNNALQLGNKLPKGIEINSSELVQVENQEKYQNMNMIPEHIEIIYELITDEKEIEAIRSYQENNRGSLPKDITRKTKYSVTDGKYITSYRNKSKPIYYENRYEFKEAIPLSDEDIEIKLRISEVKSYKTMANALHYFMILSIVMITLSIILVIISLG